MDFFKNPIKWILFFVCLTNFCNANIEKHFKKVEGKIETSQIQNIDFIYLINLDHRTDRLEHSLKQLNSYGIHPHRFSAINGKDLTDDDLMDCGVQFLPGMEDGIWALAPNGEGKLEAAFLDESSYGKTFFSKWMSHGAIGCSLSHLSILQDAYDAGYQTIWIMEDDIIVKQNPHYLANLIDELDTEVGEDGWDILYTDNVSNFHFMPPNYIPFWNWRPDFPSFDFNVCRQFSLINENFAKIGGRFYTHSMIIRRSGMKKILDFIKSHHIFIPYDHELSMINDIRLFNLRYPLVTVSLDFPSNIKE